MNKENVFVAIVFQGKFIVIERHDDKIGFPGGKIDEGETPNEAIIREVNEELNFEIKDLSRLYHIDNKQLDSKTVFFLYSANENEIKEIFENFSKAEHFLYEIFGVALKSLVSVENCPSPKEFKNEINVLKIIQEQSRS